MRRLWVLFPILIIVVIGLIIFADHKNEERWKKKLDENMTTIEQFLNR